MIEALDALLLVRQPPATIACDNGPEFVTPGRPVENCIIESGNGKLRDECLNQHHFPTRADARTALEAWREEDNTDRQHRGLAQRTPAEYAALFTPRGRAFLTAGPPILTWLKMGETSHGRRCDTWSSRTGWTRHGQPSCSSRTLRGRDPDMVPMYSGVTNLPLGVRWH